MPIGPGKHHAARLDSRALLGVRDRKDAPAPQYLVEHTGALGRGVRDDEYRGRKVCRQRRQNLAERFKTARRSADDDNVSMRHGCVSCGDSAIVSCAGALGLIGITRWDSQGLQLQVAPTT